MRTQNYQLHTVRFVDPAERGVSPERARRGHTYRMDRKMLLDAVRGFELHCVDACGTQKRLRMEERKGYVEVTAQQALQTSRSLLSKWGWRQFLDTVFSDFHLHEWPAFQLASGASDGTRWAVIVTLKNGERVECRGCSALSRDWAQFESYVWSFSGLFAPQATFVLEEDPDAFLMALE